MKKVIAFLLLAVMLSMPLASCGSDPDDLGAIIPMALCDYQGNLDPTQYVYDKDFIKAASLVFESLTHVTDSGKLELVLIEDWEQHYNADRGEYFLNIDLAFSRWNDSRVLTADHVVYAWKTILSPETNSPAAALLYDIKNAKAVKSGEMTIDDLGVAALDADTVEVQFEKPIDPELFLEAISSPFLAPLRDDAIIGKESTWATEVKSIITNGPFSIKSFEETGLYRFDFSKYYRLDADEKKDFNQFVAPYRLVTDYSKTPEQQMQAYENGEIYYVGVFTKDTYAQKEKYIKNTDTLASYTYYFDCENKVLSNPAVRRALSLALDREEIASIIGRGTKAANGFVTPAATGSTLKKSFRKEAGDVYQTTANLEEAKALLQSAGTGSGRFAITYRSDRDFDASVAEYAKGVWESLGFTVSLNGLNDKSYKKAVASGDFDVLAIDYQSPGINAYAALAPFAQEYSGAVVSVEDGADAFTPHMTGYKSDAYSALMDEVLAAETRKERNAKLIDAEKLLAEDMPATALVFFSNSYLASSELKGLETSPYGYTIFNEATLKNYAEKNEAYLASLKKD